MKPLAVILSLGLVATFGAAAEPPRAAPNRTGPAPAEQTSAAGTPQHPMSAYSALGSTLARNSRLVDLGWSDAQIEAFIGGVRAAFHGQSSPADPNERELSGEIDREIKDLDKRRRQQELHTPAGLARFIRAVRKDANLRETDSGLCFRLLTSGSGARPRPQDTIVASIECRTADDMTPLPGLGADHLRVKVGDLVPGLAEGVQMMSVDTHAVFLLPPTLSYAEGEWPRGVERGMPLVFMVHLHEIIPAPETR